MNLPSDKSWRRRYNITKGTYEEAIEFANEIGYFNTDKAIINPPSVIYSSEEIDRVLNEFPHFSIEITSNFLEQTSIEKLEVLKDKIKILKEKNEKYWKEFERVPELLAMNFFIGIKREELRRKKHEDV